MLKRKNTNLSSKVTVSYFFIPFHESKVIEFLNKKYLLMYSSIASSGKKFSASGGGQI
jgi:hypothetical protein